jgi:hypothetical protein
MVFAIWEMALNLTSKTMNYLPKAKHLGYISPLIKKKSNVFDTLSPMLLLPSSVNRQCFQDSIQFQTFTAA